MVIFAVKINISPELKWFSFFYLDHEDIIGLLFRSGVDIDIKTSDGRTPLYVATEYGINRIQKNRQSVLFLKFWHFL